MNEVQHIEAYLNKSLLPADQLLMEARLLLDKDLEKRVLWQNRVYDLVREHGRKSLKKDIENAEKKFFTEKRFTTLQKFIYNLFKS